VFAARQELHVTHIPSCSKNFNDIIANYKSQTLTELSRCLFINAVSFAAELMWKSVTQIGPILDYCRTIEWECITYWKKSERKR
jgi:hypothetical protein